MICTQEKGHEGVCSAGAVSGGCKKTAAKWFATESGETAEAPLPALPEDAYPEDAVEIPVELAAAGISAISPEELAGSSEQQLAMLYRRYVHPSTRKEAVEWAQNQVAARDLGAGA